MASMVSNVIGNPVGERDVKVTFTHPLPQLDDLTISVNPDAITWAYGLNTASYPTYGGEVVQILSVYFDDMTITGTTRSVWELETIYSWFIRYMQYATQGQGKYSSPHYNQQPVTFYYHERDWVFQLWPKSLPSFNYSRDAATSTWTLVAAVKEPEYSFSGTTIQTLSDLIVNVSTFNAQNKDLATFGVATADFGNTADLENNPFATPDAPDSTGSNVNKFLHQETSNLADTFNRFAGDWANENLNALLPQNVSVPTNIAGKKSSKASKTGKSKKK